MDRKIYVPGTKYVFYPGELENFIMSLANKRIPKPENLLEEELIEDEDAPPQDGSANGNGTSNGNGGAAAAVTEHSASAVVLAAGGGGAAAGAASGGNQEQQEGSGTAAPKKTSLLGGMFGLGGGKKSPVKAAPKYRNRKRIAGKQPWKDKLRLMMNLQTKGDKQRMKKAERERWRKSQHGLNLVDEYVEDCVIKGAPSDDNAEVIQCYLVVANDMTRVQKHELGLFVLREARESGKFPRDMLPRDVKVRCTRDVRRDPCTGLLIRDSVRDVRLWKEFYESEMAFGQMLERRLTSEERAFREAERAMAEWYMQNMAQERVEKRRARLERRQQRREHYARVRQAYLQRMRRTRDEIREHNEREEKELNETEDWSRKVENGERVEIPDFLRLQGTVDDDGNPIPAAGNEGGDNENATAALHEATAADGQQEGTVEDGDAPEGARAA
ncbi:unnamed protein product [Amoebophrya sp. A25]|nr:unnamed protein product [Amoebophrya sp. A25]|eukprot:GSA25T00009007001.1